MRVVKDFSKFVIFSEDSLLNALNKINVNKSRVIFAVSEGGVLEGVLTDGDVRRWLTSTGSIDLNTPIYGPITTNPSASTSIYNRHCLPIFLEKRLNKIKENQSNVQVSLNNSNNAQ